MLDALQLDGAANGVGMRLLGPTYMPASQGCVRCAGPSPLAGDNSAEPQTHTGTKHQVASLPNYRLPNCRSGAPHRWVVRPSCSRCGTGGGGGTARGGTPKLPEVSLGGRIDMLPGALERGQHWRGSHARKLEVLMNRATCPCSVSNSARPRTLHWTSSDRRTACKLLQAPRRCPTAHPPRSPAPPTSTTPQQGDRALN